MHYLDKDGVELNLDGFRIFICKEPICINISNSLRILEEVYPSLDEAPNVVVAELSEMNRFVALSVPRSTEGRTYKFPESLCQSYDVLDHARDIWEKYHERFSIISMRETVSIFSSLLGVLGFFSCPELAADGIAPLIEAMGDKREIPILTKKEVKQDVRSGRPSEHS